MNLLEKLLDHLHIEVVTPGGFSQQFEVASRYNPFLSDRGDTLSGAKRVWLFVEIRVCSQLLFHHTRHIHTSSISRLIIPTPALCSSSDLQRFFIFSGVTELVLECIESSFLRVLANLTPGARLTTLNWRAFCDRWWRRVAPRDPIVHYSC